MTLVAAMRDFFSREGLEKKYWIAYSGGLDSHVLLSLCHSLRQYFAIKLHAIHINHHLSSNADAWAKHCAQVCADYGIDFAVKSVKIDLAGGESLEEVARKKRYGMLADCLDDDDILLTAHHQDDQAETLLLQLFRGAGPKGLAAMPVIKPFANGLQARPLLGFSREELQQYADENHLRWIDDESNANSKWTRNFIRHDVLPLLKHRWPSVSKTIARSAAYCAEAQHLLEEFAVEGCESIRGKRENTLSVSKLLELDDARQKLLLRLWMQQQGHPAPDTKKMSAIQTDILTAAWDAKPRLIWRDSELRRHRDDLFLMKKLSLHDHHQEHKWDLSDPLPLPAIGNLTATKVRGSGLSVRSLQSVLVRFRQGGEMVELPGRGRHALKNLMQEWDVLPWDRERTPLIYIGEKLISAVGYYINESVLANSDELGFALQIEKG